MLLLAYPPPCPRARSAAMVADCSHFSIPYSIAYARQVRHIEHGQPGLAMPKGMTEGHHIATPLNLVHHWWLGPRIISPRENEARDARCIHSRSGSHRLRLPGMNTIIQHRRNQLPVTMVHATGVQTPAFTPSTGLVTCIYKLNWALWTSTKY